MKKIICIFYLLINFLFINAQPDTNTIALPNYFYISEDFNEGWWVGKIYTPFYQDTTDVITFSLIDDFNGAFAVNSSTGNITIADSTQITGKIIQQDTLIKLIFTASDATQTDTIDTCYIGIKESSYSIYYDLDAGSNGDGTINNPYDEIDNGAGFAAGEGHFLKCGTTSNDDIDLDNIISTIANPLVISSYGTGDSDTRPIIDMNDPSNPNAHCLHMGGSYVRSANIRIHNIEFEDGATGVFIRYPCDSIYINNCLAHDMGVSGTGYVGFWSIDSIGKQLIPREHWFRHCESNDNAEHGGKTQNSGVHFFNWKASGNSNGLSITSDCSGCTVQYVHSYNNNSHGMDFGADSSTLDDALLNANYIGISVNDAADINDSIIHRHLSITNNTHYGLEITDSTHDYYLENSYFYGNTDQDLYLHSTSERNYFYRNIFDGTTGTADIVDIADDADNPQAYPDSIVFAYCLFKNAGDESIYALQSTKLHIINCTFYNSGGLIDIIFQAGSTSNYMKNCIYDSIYVYSSVDTSHVYNTGIDPFINASVDSFQLNTNTRCYYDGLILSDYTQDIEGNPLNESIRSIGAYEYIQQTGVKLPLINGRPKSILINGKAKKFIIR